MKPKLTLSLPLLFASIALVATLEINTASAQSDRLQAKAARTNFVILLADDLGWGDVGFHGGTAATPNIDQLASDGVRLNRFYAFPACSPARAAMLTGRFPLRFGIRGPVRPLDVGLPANERVLVADFQDAGYRTSLIGKWHLGKSTKQGVHPTQRGFDHFYGFMDASIDYFKHTGNRGHIDWQRNGQIVEEEGYSTELLAAEAVRQIKAAGKERFCMVVAFNAPHAPFQAPEALIKKYRDRLGEREATYAAMIESMDSAIGHILKAIDEEGLKDDTVVVFASDNGAARMGTNAPFRGQKRQVYEGGIRVPCVVRAPGKLKAGSQSNQLAGIYDLFPTLAEAAMIEFRTSKPIDGKSLWENLCNGTTNNRSLFIAENDFAMIQDDWKLIQNYNGDLELFNLREDSVESENAADQQSARVARMASQLVEFQQRVAKDEVYVAEPIEDAPSLISLPEEGELLADATLRGDVEYGVLGDRRVESNGQGLKFYSGKDIDGNDQFAGDATLRPAITKPGKRWYRFTIEGMAQDNFDVEKDELYLQVQFIQKDSGESLDLIKTRIYPQIIRERADLRDEATNKSLGDGVWRTYAMDFKTPFEAVEKLNLSVGFSGGKGESKQSEFWVRSMNLVSIPVPENYKPPKTAHSFPQPDPNTLVALGGRWYFDPQGGERTPPKQFDHSNSHQLLYQGKQFEAPFAGNMSSWLRAGYLDLEGKPVNKDEARPDAVVITFTDKHLVMKSRNLPNHPTATFPDRWRVLDGNPSHIQEQANTWYIPLEPSQNPKAIAMDAKNSNQALPMGAIGVATNGVIFFNPFDHLFETDAVWRLDRCCGHPSPRNQYHYHKYPVCVKTPWSDEGEAHSCVIGFAFDGYPVYGPYEAKGLLAKDDKTNPLNDFNLHEDDQRGPHYHVTPGKYPHIIGGYWGQMESLNRPARRASP